MDLTQEYEMLRQEHMTLRQEYAELRASKERPKQQGCAGVVINLAFWLLVVGLTVMLAATMGPDLLVSYGLVSPETMAGILHLKQPGTTIAPQATVTAPRITTSGGNISAPAPVLARPLPLCEDVTDTRTACQQDQGAQEEPAPTIEPTPAYMTVCVTEPGSRPCWLPEGQPWSPPASVPETPIVLLPEPTWAGAPFLECADWHPPMAPIEGCP